MALQVVKPVMKPPYRPGCCRPLFKIVINTPFTISARCLHNGRPKPVETDEFGVPLKPTWSVRRLLDSYSPPTIDNKTFDKLHRLAALVPLAEGSTERELQREELQELVKLVNAVQCANIPKGKEGDVPDGRIYPVPQEIVLEEAQVNIEEEPQPIGRELLQYSQIADETSYTLPKVLKPRTEAP